MSSGIRRITPYQGYIQDWQNEISIVASSAPVLEIRDLLRDPNTQIHYLMFDSHYYLSDYEITIPGQVYIVGGDFPTYPGTYFLPHC